MAHATAAAALSRARSLADLLADLGDIPPDRVRLNPPPGTATERDVISIHDHEDRLYELVEGTLVEKVMGAPESVLAWVLGVYLGVFLRQHDLGFCMGADGMARIAPGLVRIPDLSFVSWARLPAHEVPQEPIFGLAPDLAVEVISPSNTKAEMERKLREFFGAGVRLVWYIYPKGHTVRVYTSPRRSTLLRDGQVLDGGAVLPGFALPLTDLFDRAAGRPGR